MSKLVTLDPTDSARQILTLEDSGRVTEKIWHANADRAGVRLASELAAFTLTSTDTLRVVRGPGGLTPLRLAAIVANTTALVTGCRLETRRADEVEWSMVASVEPVYSAPPWKA